MDDEARAAHAESLRSMLEKWIRPSNIEAYEREQDDTHYMDPRPTLQAVRDASAEAWDPDSEALFLSTRAHIKDRGVHVVLIVGGKEWRAPRAAGPLLCELVNGRPIRVGTLLERVPGPLLSELVTAGILAVS